MTHFHLLLIPYHCWLDRAGYTISIHCVDRKFVDFPLSSWIWGCWSLWNPPQTFSFEMGLKPSAVVATKCDVKPEETLPKVDASLNGSGMCPRRPKNPKKLSGNLTCGKWWWYCTLMYLAHFQRKPNDEFFCFCVSLTPKVNLNLGQNSRTCCGTTTFGHSRTVVLTPSYLFCAPLLHIPHWENGEPHLTSWKWVYDGDIRDICNLYFAYLGRGLPQDDPFGSEGMFESTDFQLLAFDLFGIHGLGLIWESTGLFTDPTRWLTTVVMCYSWGYHWLLFLVVNPWAFHHFPPARFAARTSCIVPCAVPSQVLVTCRKTPGCLVTRANHGG